MKESNSRNSVDDDDALDVAGDALPGEQSKHNATPTVTDDVADDSLAAMQAGTHLLCSSAFSQAGNEAGATPCTLSGSLDNSIPLEPRQDGRPSERFVDPSSSSQLLQVPDGTLKVPNKRQQQKVRKAAECERQQQQVAARNLRDEHDKWLADMHKEIEGIKIHDPWEGKWDSPCGVSTSPPSSIPRTVQAMPANDARPSALVKIQDEIEKANYEYKTIFEVMELTQVERDSAERREILEAYQSNYVLSREYIARIAREEIVHDQNRLRTTGMHSISDVTNPECLAQDELVLLLNINDNCRHAHAPGATMAGCLKRAHVLSNTIASTMASVRVAKGIECIEALSALRADYMQVLLLLPIGDGLRLALERCLEELYELGFSEHVASA